LQIVLQRGSSPFRLTSEFLSSTSF
jgi:hypothetical protein